MNRVRVKDTGISGGSPIARSNRARERAEGRRCPDCNRKSALKTEVIPGQVVTYCRWDDCNYGSGTIL